MNENQTTNQDHLNKEGTKVPHTAFQTRVRDESAEGENKFSWKERFTDEFFAGKKVVLFSLPGAFTPTCSSTHLPGYENDYDEYKAMGIDEVICISVNDAFVMFQWAKNLGIEKVFMLPDGNGEFTEALGMLVSKKNLGFGKRSWRYSMYVEDGTIKKMFIEPGFSDDCPSDPFEVSDSPTMMSYLKESK